MIVRKVTSKITVSTFIVLIENAFQPYTFILLLMFVTIILNNNIISEDKKKYDKFKIFFISV